jgi:hypothetical protein
MKPNASYLLMCLALAVLGVCAAFHVSDQSLIVVASLGVIGVGLRDRARLFPERGAEKANPPTLRGSAPGGSETPAGGGSSEETTDPEPIVKAVDEDTFVRRARAHRVRMLASDLIVAWSTHGGIAAIQKATWPGAAWETASAIVDAFDAKEKD